MGMGVTRIMRHLFKLFILSVFASIALTGCTTCNEVKVSTSSNGVWNAEVRHRVCGSYSGYAVAVFRANERSPGYGEGYKEPFQAMYKTGELVESTVPVRIEWNTDGHLLIHHTTRSSIDDSKSKPMVTKADTNCQDVFIDYDPEPVIWSK